MKLDKLREKIGSGFLRDLLEKNGIFTEEEIRWIMEVVNLRLG